MIGDTMTYRYSGMLHTKRVSLNERLYPKHQAALKRAYTAYVTPLILSQRPQRLFRLLGQPLYPMPECREWIIKNIKKTERPENES